MPPIGSKLSANLILKFLNRLSLTALLISESWSVWPSGSARATCSVAILPPAPVRFSTKNCSPATLLRPAPTTRARMSVGPPGAKPTTSLTGLFG